MSRQVPEIINDFQEFCNQVPGHGYIKLWKAHGMITTCNDIPDILLDKERALKYIRNCLEMEGFRQEGFDQIWVKLKEVVKEYKEATTEKV